MSSPKILVLSPWSVLPPHFGSSERTYNLAQGLAAHYRVTLLHTDYDQIKISRTQTDIPGVKSYKVCPSRRWAQLFNPFLILKGLQLIRQDRPALLISAHLWSGLHTLILHYLTGVPYILDEHNVEYVRWNRMQRKGISVLTWAERLSCQKAAAVFCVSEADKKLLMKLGIPAEKIHVIRNAVDLTQYRPDPAGGVAARRELGLSDQTPLVLFFGKLDYQPNSEAVDLIVREIAPRVLAQNPGVRFVICGYRPPAEQYAGSPVTFTGMVPRIEDYINAAQAVIVPLISGGGTKFKIVQAIACGRPVITTPIGAEGLDDAAAWMQVTDDWDEFARLIGQACTHPAAVSGPGWEAFCAGYRVEEMVTRARQVIERCRA